MFLWIFRAKENLQRQPSWLNCEKDIRKNIAKIIEAYLKRSWIPATFLEMDYWLINLHNFIIFLLSNLQNSFKCIFSSSTNLHNCSQAQSGKTRKLGWRYWNTKIKVKNLETVVLILWYWLMCSNGWMKLPRVVPKNLFWNISEMSEKYKSMRTFFKCLIKLHAHCLHFFCKFWERF